MSDISDARGAGVEALREQNRLRRSTSVAPPAPPAVTRPVADDDPQTSPDEPTTDRAAAAGEPESAVATEAAPAPAPSPRRQRSSSARSSKRSTEDDELIGQPKGNLRQISVRLPQPIRDLLDEDKLVDPDLSLGLIGMDAVRGHVHELISGAAVKGQETDSAAFVPRRQIVRRSARGPKIPTPMSVTPAEAKRLVELKGELGMSVNLIIERSLELYYAARLPS